MNTGINQNPILREKKATSIKKVSLPLKKKIVTHIVYAKSILSALM